MYATFCKAIVVALLLTAATSSAQTPGLDDLAAQLGSQLASTKTKTITICPFINDQGYSSSLSAYLIDRLNRLLASQGHGFRLITRSQSEAILRELGNRYPAEINSQSLQALASRLSTDSLVTGSFSVTGNSIMIDASLLDPHSTNILWGHSVRIDKAAVAEVLGNPASVQPIQRALSSETFQPSDASRVAIQSGTTIRVQINDALSSDRVQVGQEVRALLVDEISASGRTVAARGSAVKLKIAEKDQYRLKLQLESIFVATNQFAVVVAVPYEQRGTVSKTKIFGALLNNQPLPLAPQPAAVPAKTIIQFRTLSDVYWP